MWRPTGWKGKGWVKRTWYTKMVLSEFSAASLNVEEGLSLLTHLSRRTDPSPDIWPPFHHPSHHFNEVYLKHHRLPPATCPVDSLLEGRHGFHAPWSQWLVLKPQRFLNDSSAGGWGRSYQKELWATAVWSLFARLLLGAKHILIDLPSGSRSFERGLCGCLMLQTILQTGHKSRVRVWSWVRSYAGSRSACWTTATKERGR